MENNFHRQPRSGWNSRENELLAQQVRQAKGARLPLRTAFEAVARATGRCPNSVRNHYYAALHARQNGVPAFIPFSEEEGAALVREILLSCTAGESVPYNQVFSAYQARALQALTDESIPYGVRELVSEYFSSLEK